jgi:TonB family protein
VVTEYAWGATKCDPCPGPDAALTAKELAELGADVTDGQDAVAAAKRPMTPVIRQGKVVAKGALSPEIIRRIARAHVNELRHCYGLGLARDPKLAGELVLEFEIDEGGRVRDAAVGRSTLTDERVGTCSVSAVKRWKFPKPEGGGKVVVRYPLVLQGQVAASGSFGNFGGLGQSPSPYVLTRLHARYDAGSLGEDLVFKAVDPIVGGREFDDAEGQLERGASPSSINNFQGRYAIRHAWTGPITCAEPRRGNWGGPPLDKPRRDEPVVARELTKVARGGALASFVTADAAAQLGLAAGAGDGAKEAAAAAPDAGAAEPGGAATESAGAEAAAGDATQTVPSPREKPPGCACATDGPGGGGALASLVGLLALVRRRRRT